uniref:Putative secreted protein n=1 Tax=Anopheles darlingi TaxID=43151 RepID=A0A2M4D081_ANODA
MCIFFLRSMMLRTRWSAVLFMLAMIFNFSGECGRQLGASPLSGQFSGSRARHGRRRRQPSRCHVTCSIWCCSFAFSRHSASPFACSSASCFLRASSNFARRCASSSCISRNLCARFL